MSTLRIEISSAKNLLIWLAEGRPGHPSQTWCSFTTTQTREEPFALPSPDRLNHRYEGMCYLLTSKFINLWDQTKLRRFERLEGRDWHDWVAQPAHSMLMLPHACSLSGAPGGGRELCVCVAPSTHVCVCYEYVCCKNMCRDESCINVRFLFYSISCNKAHKLSLFISC